MKILIAGESCVDEFIYCQTSRLNPEAPTPVVVPNNIVRNFGMAANVVSHFQNLKIDNFVFFFLPIFQPNNRL